MASDPNTESAPLVAPAWTSVTIGVADLDEALTLWQGALGFELRAQREGADAQLETLWGLPGLGINRQALLATPGADTGMLHFVEFAQPGPAVREGANAFDEVPKNLDIYVHDMARRLDDLRQAGYRFRNDEFSEVTAPDGTVFREMHMPSHDALNIVLLEVIGKSLPFNPLGFAGVGPLIVSVPDAAGEAAFYRETMEFSLLSHNFLHGPEIERMVGLPAGAALDVSIWGDAAAPFGQVEVIDYQGVEGRNLYPLTVPPQRGILHVTYAVTDLRAFAQRLQQAGIEHTVPVDSDVLPGRGRFLRFRSPAGLNLEAFQPARD